MRIITIEEHTSIETLNNALAKCPNIDAQYSSAAHGKDLPYAVDGDAYADLGTERIADIDKHCIAMQVLSCPNPVVASRGGCDDCQGSQR